MPQSFRHPEILATARQAGKVTVEGLAAQFGVSVQTIRRDLTELCDEGALQRVHGGAVLRSGVENIHYEARKALNAEAKRAIAEACACDIPDGSALFLNIGTTTEAVARALTRHDGLLVVTNNMNVANILIGNPNCEVIVTGGTVRRSDGGLIGNLTERMVSQFKFDNAVIGCSAVDADGDLQDYDLQEVGVSQTAMTHSRRTVLVADRSKLERTAPVRIASLEDIETVYTDAVLPAELGARCAEWGTDVRVCAA